MPRHYLGNPNLGRYVEEIAEELELGPQDVAGESDQTRSGLCYDRGMMVRNISQAKAELSALIEEVQKGNEVILAKAGKPVAKLVAYRGVTRPRTPGSMTGKIWIAPDFDTLPEDMADAFGIQEPRG